MKIGTILLVKEPFFFVPQIGWYCIRSDHVSDLIRLEQWDKQVPAQWSAKDTKTPNSTHLRQLGNTQVKKQCWLEASLLYTQAINFATNDEDRYLAYLNRSLVFLRMGRPFQALQDVTAMNGKVPPAEKGMFRESRALYDMQKFDECLEKINCLIRAYPDNLDAKADLVRVNKRLKERQDGEYDFAQLYEQTRTMPPMMDCATFSKHVEIRESPGKGRGLFTTKAFRVGDLILCEKAFMYFLDEGELTGNRNAILVNNYKKDVPESGDTYEFLAAIIQKLHHDPEASTMFAKLHHGDIVGLQPGLQADSKQVVDTFAVERAMVLNYFATSIAASDATFCLQMASNGDVTKLKEAYGYGLWYLASYINHSCFYNCTRSNIGDMMIVRATRNIPAGSELEFWYYDMSEFDSYGAIQEYLSTCWQFNCTCIFCQEKSKTPENDLRQRHAYLANAQTLPMHPQSTFITRARMLIKKIEATYPLNRNTCAKPEMARAYNIFGLLLRQDGRFFEAIAMFYNSLEALGFVLGKRPRAGSSPFPDLHIKKCGFFDIQSVPSTLVMLFKLYQSLAPRSCTNARAYAEMCHMMMYGEKETFDEMWRLA
ncbi:hypothetical protein NLG97_g8639 [Lecanicillium saksenae]|uniref:Uncharacterized protein n=1 Tax=Lecanicillium saksenae TaxID=468837 RepID=A0ACC1QLC0_9HYPO|nr:hypothetical protein NLG97_g8639 [Lecanicillium saksenae]